MKIIELSCYGIVLELNGKGSGTIKSDLIPDTPPETEEERIHDARLNAIESIILAHACAGINIEDPKYIEGIETAVDACANNS